MNAKRVARLMKTHHIAGIRPRHPKRTTIAARHKPGTRIPAPFTWHKTADEIFETMASYLQRIPQTGH